MEFDYRKYGFKKTDDGSYIDEDGIVEVCKDKDSWEYTSHIIGSWEAYEYGFDSPVTALQTAYEKTPSEYHIRKAIEEAFDSLDDWVKVGVAREMYVEHDYPFEWSDVFDLDEVLSWSDRDELIHIITRGAIRNQNDPVRYGRDNELEQVTHKQLYEEVAESRDEIIDAVIECLRDDRSIYTTDVFDDVCRSFADGSWKEDE